MDIEAVIYTRFSPRPNAATSESCEAQEDQCKQYARANMIAIKGIFQDKAMSGCEEDRPGLWEAVASLKSHNILLVYRLDRLARSVYLSHMIEQEVKNKKARIVSSSGEGTWNDGPEDQLIRNILHALAEYQRKVIGSRVKAAMLRHQKNGKRMSDIPPYGMDIDPENPKMLIINEKESSVIAIVRELHARGTSYRGIARWLNAQGYRNRANHDLDHCLVRSIIRRF
jgi:site-specific DNA recombinase